MPKIIPHKDSDTIVVKTKSSNKAPMATQWWKAESKAERGRELVSTAGYLKENLQYRYRQASVFSRLYGNLPLFGGMGGSMSKQSPGGQLPIDRPTMNVIQSCVDTLVSRLTQSKPSPTFLTDNGDYKQRKLAKQLNEFVAGELYQTEAYSLAAIILRDAEVLGTGCIKVYETQDHRVALERVLLTEVLVDPNDGLYGDPRQLMQLKLVDRGVLQSMHPDSQGTIVNAEQAYPDNAQDSSRTVADQVMVVEGWHLPSGKNTKDGKHIIATTAGVIFEEDYDKDTFPFVFLHYSPRMLGFFGQGLVEQLMGTQMEINKLLMTISQSINLVGVPRIFIEDGSKIVKAHINNQIGSIVTFRGTLPTIVPGSSGLAADIYAQLQRLVDYAYQQSGISSLAAASQKPAGLDSGAALREYDDLQSDRFATLNKRYDNMFIDLAYIIIDMAKSIAEREGSYQTVYPNKDGTREIDLPASEILDNPFVIQCFDSSSLPRDPAGRMQHVVEMIQSGMVDIAEGRRLLDFPDLASDEKLANAGKERILQALDKIVEDGKYTPPDTYMNPQQALELSNQYYNLYSAAKLPESKKAMLIQFNTQAIALMQAAQPPAPAMPPQPAQAAPAPLPTSPTLTR